MELKNITIGSDPEFFATDGKKLIPSYMFLPGTKEEPFELEGGYFVQRDNVLVEGNIPPASTAKGFESNMNSLKDIISINFLKPQGLVLLSQDSGNFDKKDLNHPEAITLGCSAYETVWATQSTQNVKDLITSTKRPAGFHIHVGYEFADSEDAAFKSITDTIIAKLFDYFVILPSYKIHLDEFRNKYYGGLGKIRHKSYGVELRSLGGFFTQERYFQPLFNQIQYIIELLRDEDIFFSVFHSSSVEDLDKIPALANAIETKTKVLTTV